MYNVIEGATLTWSELSEVLLDVETQINRRPLSYMENDVQLPTLTPSSFLFQRTNQLPEEEPWRIEEENLRKRAKYLITCKDNLWKRWQREYLTALRERHNLIHKPAKYHIKIGEAVIVQTDDKNRGKWPLAIVHRSTTLSRTRWSHTSSAAENQEWNTGATSTTPVPSGVAMRLQR